MRMKTKQEVLKEHLKEWLKTKPYSPDRKRLRMQLAKTVKLHPRSVGRAMKRLQLADSRKTVKRGRAVLYTKDVDAALYQIWEAMDYPCAEILRPMIGVYIDAFHTEHTWNIQHNTEHLLRCMSEATIKRRIAGWREKESRKRGYSSTVPSPLKDSIPIRKSHTWWGLPPGHTQTDTVVHCGDLLTGDVVYSLGLVDFSTYWVAYTAQWNKGEVATQKSLSRIREQFPFPLLEIHPDTGTEFINHHLVRWCAQEQLDITRSEPYKKNDNMCIEERNNNIARRHLGYARMDQESLADTAAAILKTASLIHNHFRPVRRMLTKKRIGAKWHRTFEKVAKTPYERVLASDQVSQADKDILRKQHESFNPLALKRELDTLKEQLRNLLK